MKLTDSQRRGLKQVLIHVEQTLDDGGDEYEERDTPENKADLQAAHDWIKKQLASEKPDDRQLPRTRLGLPR